MAVAGRTNSYGTAGRRHPRLVRRTVWLRRHSRLVGATAAVLIAVVALLDLFVHPVTMAGFYLVPLTLLALAGRERRVLFGGVLSGFLTVAAMVLQGNLDTGNWFNLLYGGLAGAGLIVLAYLIRRLSAVSEYAMLRAQLAEAGADILMSGGETAELDELLEYAVARLGELLRAREGIVLVREGSRWSGRAAVGLAAAPGAFSAEPGDVPLADEALRDDAIVQREVFDNVAAVLGPLAPLAPFERVLVLPMRSMERDIGVIVYNRPSPAGEYNAERVAVAGGLAQYLGVAIENVRLMREISSRRHDLEVVRDASLDFAQSLEMTEVLEAVVSRLIDALAMPACDVFEVDEEAGTVRILVSIDENPTQPGSWVGRELSLTRLGVTGLAVADRRPVLVTSIDDPRLSQAERDELTSAGHCTQFSIPLYIRERVLAVVELYDSAPRHLSADEIELARTICRFAALAVDTARLFDQERAITERRDRLARRLHRLQSFAIDLNRRLDRADEQEIFNEVAGAAADLVRTRAAAVVSGAGELSVVRAFVLAEPAGAAAGEAAEADLLERCRVAVAPSAEAAAGGGDILMASVVEAGGLLIAPLEVEATHQASALVVADKADGGFDDEDRLLLATLAAQLSSSLHNATAYQREHAIAETFQAALLPEPPLIPGVEIGVRYRAATNAARVGGDFYDLVMLGPGRLMVSVGDVCGKGLGAAAQSAIVRYMLRAYAAEGSPGEALSRLNAALSTQAPNQPFVTLVVAYVDVARHMFEYAVAGHPRPIVMASHGEFPIPTEGNVPVGIFRGAVYPTNRAVLPEDARIVMHTDGITDARRERVMFGEHGVRQAVTANLGLPPQELADALLEAVRDYADGVLDDDCAVVSIRLP